MKINSIKTMNVFYNSNNYKLDKTKNAQTSNPVKSFSSFYPSKNNFAFLGGYSLKLEEVEKNMNSEQYPPDIEDKVHQELVNKNIDDKTLYDVHFEKYKGILDCFNLEELKEKYPEFSDVVSVYDVDAIDNSFIGRFKNGESEVFANQEDLTLQLIKLYWGRGFSLNDLANYIKDNAPNEIANIYYTMCKKLNIPLMNNRYASVLKLSNKKYNEDFTQQMSIKLKEAHEAKIQRAEGEAVIIPSGPLSEAHKKHISEGLIRYYQENPEKISLMSKRQMQYYDEHSKEREKLSSALDYAWNKSRDGATVKKELTRFSKKYCQISDKELLLEENLTPAQNQMLSEFWKRNRWAKDKFSKAMKDGWEYASFDVEEYINLQYIPHKKLIFQNMPQKTVDAVYAIAQEKGINIPKEFIGKCIIDIDCDKLTKIQTAKLQSYAKTIVLLCREYENKFPKTANDNANARQLAIASTFDSLKENNANLPERIRKDKQLREYLYFIFKKILDVTPLYKETKQTRGWIAGISTAELDNMIYRIAHGALNIDCPEILYYLEAQVNYFYDKFSSQEYSFLNKF